MIRMIEARKEFVDPCDTSPIERVLGEAEQTPEVVRQLQGSIVLVFPDHEREDEIVWMDPKVRAWAKQAHERIPHLLYYLLPEPDAAAMNLLVSAFGESDSINVTVEDGEARVEATAPLLALVAERLQETAIFAQQMADDWRPIVTGLAAPLGPQLADTMVETVEASLS